jgi:hypothetical protein
VVTAVPKLLPSGRYQAIYTDPDSTRRSAPETFASKRAAEQWLSTTEAELLRGEWTNPDLRRVTLGEFGHRWIAERPGLRPRTVDLYRLLFGKHIEPHLGRLASGNWRPGAFGNGVPGCWPRASRRPSRRRRTGSCAPS